jgi:hypothetical protein
LPDGLGDYISIAPDNDVLATLGLPPLEEVPAPFCVPFIADQNNVCTRAQFFQGIRSWHPVAHPFSTPTYSNPNFGILAWALEAIVNDGRSFPNILQDNVVSALAMERTFLHISPLENVTNAMIPFNATASDWFLAGSFDDAAGTYYSSLSDLNAFGRSILRSTLLPRSVTNRWLRPFTHTSDPRQSVGMPFEIYRQEVPVSRDSQATRLVDIYTKGGDVGLYSTMIVLVPDYDIGFTILTAGAGTTALLRVYLTELMRNHLLPAMEELAAAEAQQIYAGTYVDKATNSSITIGLDADQIGMGVEAWTSRGVDMRQDGQGIKSLYAFDTEGPVNLRLQSMGLSDAPSRRVSFRMIPKDDSLPEHSMWSCFSWAGVSALAYGGLSIDQVVFEVDDAGRGATIELPAFRTVMTRVE